MNRSLLRATLLAASALFAAPLVRGQQPNPIPQTYSKIYPQPAQAKAQVQEAMQLAAQQHKRILLVFGADQCADCQAYEKLLDEEANRAQLSEHFLLVHIDVGPDRKQNLDIVHRYGTTVQRSIPAVSVIDSQDHVLHAETIVHARNMSASDVTAFLNKWRG